MSGGRELTVRRVEPADRPWLHEALDARWGGPWQAYGGELVDAAGADGFVALDPAGCRAGFLLQRSIATGQEIVVLEALVPGEGVGTALVEACVAAARAAGVTRLTVVTTNDNLRALGFYQRRDFRLAALRPGAVDAARRDLKPAIPETGEDGLPIRDEIVLERDVSKDPGR